MKGYEPVASFNALLFAQRFLKHSCQSTPKRIRSLQPKQDQQRGPKMQQLKNPETRETSVLQQKPWYHPCGIFSYLFHLSVGFLSPQCWDYFQNRYLYSGSPSCYKTSNSPSCKMVCLCREPGMPMNYNSIDLPREKTIKSHSTMLVHHHSHRGLW